MSSRSSHSPGCARCSTSRCPTSRWSRAWARPCRSPPPRCGRSPSPRRSTGSTRARVRRVRRACCEPEAASRWCGTPVTGRRTGPTSSGASWAPWSTTRRGVRRELQHTTALADTPHFGPRHHGSFLHVQQLTPDEVVARVRGVSHVAMLPTTERGRAARRGAHPAGHPPRDRGSRARRPRVPHRRVLGGATPTAPWVTRAR